MPAIRENRTALAPDAAALSPFNVADKNVLPERVHPDVQAFLEKVRAVLAEHPPELVDVVVAYTPVTWEKKPTEIKLYAVGRFGRYYEGLRLMAKALGHRIEYDDIHPATHPLTADQWREKTELEDNLLGRLKRRGVLIYERE